MQRFEIGDKVELVKPRVGWEDKTPKGSIGVVINTDHDGEFYIKVMFDSGFVSGFWLASRFILADGKSSVERKIAKLWNQQSYVKKGVHHVTV